MLELRMFCHQDISLLNLSAKQLQYTWCSFLSLGFCSGITNWLHRWVPWEPGTCLLSFPQGHCSSPLPAHAVPGSEHTEPKPQLGSVGQALSSASPRPTPFHTSWGMLRLFARVDNSQPSLHNKSPELKHGSSSSLVLPICLQPNRETKDSLSFSS